MTSRSRTITIDESLARAVEASGHDLASVVEDALRQRLDAPVAAELPVGGDLPTLSGAFLKALLDRDAAAARAVVLAARAAVVDTADVYAEVLQPALAQIGHLWAVGEINVADEHFATALSQTLMGELRTPVTPEGGRLAVVTSTPDELHQLGTQMVADLLARDGWEVLELGAATPAPDLVELVEAECPDLVALSVTTAGRLPGLSEVIARLAGADPRPFIVVGGALMREPTAGHARELGADLVLTDVREMLPALRERFPPVEV